jgi:hypothetical protein
MRTSSNLPSSCAMLGAFLAVHVTTTTQALAQKSEQPSTTVPTVLINPSNCRKVGGVIHCDLITPQGRLTVQFPAGALDDLSKKLSE